MTASGDRLAYLYRQYISRSSTREELQEFFEYVRDPAWRQALEEMSDQQLETAPIAAGLPAIDWEHMYHTITRPGQTAMNPEQTIIHPGQTDQPPVYNTDSDRRDKSRLLTFFTRSRVAAAIIMITLGAGAYLFLTRRQPTAPAVASASKEISAGYNKAILILGNGDSITLDSAHTGALTTQGNTTVINLTNGGLAYNPTNTDTKKENTVFYNRLSTPRGGQYQLTLPDGTKVWLNAASSIVYPTAFIGSDRTVEITGEAYFEVTHDKRHPFKVKAGGHVIEDLGTRFNVNVYADEPTQVSTLLEGAIRIEGHILHPGEAAVIPMPGIIAIVKADPEQAIAWKNGLFDFTDTDLKTVMRQLARWYNVDIKYEGNIPDRQFTGMIGRSLTLNQVLKGLTRELVHYRFEGNQLIITP